MKSNIKILFVCTGNTCRSPMAEAIWRAMGGQGSSAGVAAWSGQPVARYAQEAAARHGGRLSDHRARDLDEIRGVPDLVLTMTESQRHEVVARRPQWAERTFCLGDYVGEAGDIPDPMGQDQAAYNAVADHVRVLLGRLKDRIRVDTGNEDR